METNTFIFALLIALIAGIGTGFILRKFLLNKEDKSIEEETKKILNEANSKAKEIVLEAKNEALKAIENAKNEEERKRLSLEKLETRLEEKEDNLEKKIAQAENSRSELEKKLESVKNLKEDLESSKVKQEQELQKIASLSKEEAKAILLKEVEEASRNDLAEQIKKAEENMRKEANEKAKFMIADAIQKYAAEVATESTVSVVSLPSDEMKGRIIGKEGRNVMAFEQATGVDVIIDDTPGSIVLSGFDLVRRYIAKISLEKLLQDGRIHPARIEEVVEKTKDEVAVMIKELGDKAAMDTGVAGLPSNLIKLLGRLKFRTSHGQNVLKHSMEVAYLAANLANELGADASICRKAGLLHDIGKSVDHEIQGHHAEIGKDLLKKFDISKEIIHCVETHEGDKNPQSLEAMIVSAANEIAKTRPGAKRDNLDNFIKRLSELENTANSFTGVKSSYAVQAGNEVRIFVKSEEIDDYGMVKLSHDIVRKIEKDLQFPGQIKINLVRETRAEDIAK